MSLWAASICLMHPAVSPLFIASLDACRCPGQGNKDWCTDAHMTQRLSKAAWIKVGGPRLLERLLEDPTDRTGLAPVTAVEPSSLELAFLAKHNARGRRMSPF
jgi:hypothetical protein